MTNWHLMTLMKQISAVVVEMALGSVVAKSDSRFVPSSGIAARETNAGIVALCGRTRNGTASEQRS